MTWKPNGPKGFKELVDADFVGGFDKSATDHSSCERLIIGVVITCANCPTTWKSKLQTDISLSATEENHIDLSLAFREAAPLM